ncbi:hypothetical protein ABPG72_015276 [Tetrahymena utriculariae]
MLHNIQGGTDCRVLLCGPHCSGKSSIMDTLQNNFNYNEKEYFESAGILGCIVHTQLQNLGQYSFKMTEISGIYFQGEQMKFLTKAIYRFQQNQYIVFTYNRQKRQLFDKIKKALQILSQYLNDKFIYILGTFSDVNQSLLEVTDLEGKKLAAKYNAQYLSYSSKQKPIVKSLFYSIGSCQEFINRHPSNVSELKNYINVISQMKRQKESAVYQYKVLQNMYDQKIRREIIYETLRLISPISSQIQKILQNQQIYQFIFV